MREQQNLPTVRPAHIITAQAACPIPLGSVGIWFDGTSIKIRNSDGSDGVVSASSSVASISTSDATPTTIATIPIPLGKTLSIEADIDAKQTGGPDGASYEAEASFSNNAGVITANGSAAVEFNGESDPAWGGPSFVISGTDVLLQVTGKLATNIAWSVEYATHQA